MKTRRAGSLGFHGRGIRPGTPWPRPPQRVRSLRPKFSGVPRRRRQTGLSVSISLLFVATGWRMCIGRGFGTCDVVPLQASTPLWPGAIRAGTQGHRAWRAPGPEGTPRFRKTTRESGAWKLFFRYQSQTERTCHRAIEEFERLKGLPAELPNEPVSAAQPESPQPLKPVPNKPLYPPRTTGGPETPIHPPRRPNAFQPLTALPGLRLGPLLVPLIATHRPPARPPQRPRGPRRHIVQ